MRLTIRHKLLGVITLITLAALAGFGVLVTSSNDLSDQLHAEIEAKIRGQVSVEAREFALRMTMIEKNVYSLAAIGESLYRRRDSLGENARPELEKLLTAAIARFPEAVGGGLWYEPDQLLPGQKYVGPYAYWDNGKVVFTWEYEDPAYDYHSQAWYALAVPQGWDRVQRRGDATYWTEPFLDPVTNLVMVTATAVMYGENGRIIGLSNTDLSLKELQVQAEKLAILPGAVPFVYHAKSGRIIAYPKDAKRIMTAAADLPFGHGLPADDVKPGQGDQTITLDGQTWTLFHVASPTGLVLGLLVPHAEMFASAQALERFNRLATILVAATLVALSLVAAWIVGRVVLSPLAGLGRYADDIAAGRLDASVRVRCTGEILRLQNAMLAMVEALKAKMREAQVKSEEADRHAQAAEKARRQVEAAMAEADRAKKTGVLQAASRLDDIVDAVQVGARDIAGRAHRIQQGAENQRERLHSAATAMQQMTATVVDVARSASQAAQEAGQAQHHAARGAEVVNGSVRAMSGVRSLAETLKADMHELGRQAEAIGQVMNVIGDIADQTNLLALNAAIEAARAGEAGRGFAVVADEVRKLAEKTVQATGEVGSSIQSIQRSAQNNISAMDAAVTSIASATDLSDQSGAALAQILDGARTTAGQIQGIAAASEEQAAATEEVNLTIERINVIAQEAVEDASLALEAIRRLEEQSDALKDVIGRLKTENAS